jgi:HAD domain in Swiss Army Knife RNA repair proteins
MAPKKKPPQKPAARILPRVAIFLDVDGVVAVPSNVQSGGTLLHGRAPPLFRLRSALERVSEVVADLEPVNLAGDQREQPQQDDDNSERGEETFRVVDAAIVLSTSWRVLEHSRMVVLRVLKESGITPRFPVIGDTPQLPSQSRADEILNWVSTHSRARRALCPRLPALKFVAVDDLDLHCGGSGLQEQHFVHTEFNIGIDAERETAIVRALERQLQSTQELSAEGSVDASDAPSSTDNSKFPRTAAALERLVATLEGLQVPYALTGPLAAGAHAGLRDLGDSAEDGDDGIDVFVWPDVRGARADTHWPTLLKCLEREAFVAPSARPLDDHPRWRCGDGTVVSRHGISMTIINALEDVKHVQVRDGSVAWSSYPVPRPHTAVSQSCLGVAGVRLVSVADSIALAEKTGRDTDIRLARKIQEMRGELLMLTM